MTYEGTIVADTVVIHPFTVPDEFARGGSSRTITVALAYDPEVRRTRREYLAGRMSFDLVRNMSVDDIRTIWVKQPEDKDRRLDLPDDRRRPKLEPGTRDSEDSIATSTKTFSATRPVEAAARRSEIPVFGP
jgi:hypothetical protein